MQLVQLVVAITSVLFAPAWLVSILLWRRKGKQGRRGNTHALAHTHSASLADYHRYLAHEVAERAGTPVPPGPLATGGRRGSRAAQRRQNARYTPKFGKA